MKIVVLSMPQLAIVVLSLLCSPDGTSCAIIYCILQVALVMLLGQRLVHGLLSQGYSGIGQVVEYTAMMVEDNTADFIINNGGWVNIKYVFY